MRCTVIPSVVDDLRLRTYYYSDIFVMSHRIPTYYMLLSSFDYSRSVENVARVKGLLPRYNKAYNNIL